MKDTALYLEADEDITSAIDKLQKAPAGPVQIVVPKRSTMLQSIINLKLLKKAAASSGKELVLVTGDKIATELAARVGLAVAPSLGAKAVLAKADTPAAPPSNEDIIEDEDDAPSSAVPTNPTPPAKVPTSKRPLLKRRSVSEGPPVPPPTPVEPDDEADAPSHQAAPKVPNFNKLQHRVLWIGLAVFLIGGYFGGMYLFTSAKVTLYAIATRTNVDLGFTVDPALKQSNVAAGALAGQTVTTNKTLTASFTPTGKKDNGTKATGSVTFQNCEDSNTYPLAAGNTLTSQGLNVVTDEAVTIPAGTFKNGGKDCTSPTVSVGVTASANGDKYNLTSATFTTPKLVPSFHITGSLSGGTSKTATVVAQSDVDAAKVEAVAKDKDGGTHDLQSHVPGGHTILSPSITQTVGDVTASPAVGEEATSANISIKVTYTGLAVKRTDYEAMVRAQESKQVGGQNQIYDDGLDSAQLTSTPPDSNGKQAYHLTTEAYSGPKQDTKAIAEQLSGERYGDAVDTAKKLPGISRVEMNVTPGWATSLPRASQITIVIQVANNQ